MKKKFTEYQKFFEVEFRRVVLINDEEASESENDDDSWKKSASEILAMQTVRRFCGAPDL